jgi:hypothetical protein
MLSVWVWTDAAWLLMFCGPDAVEIFDRATFRIDRRDNGAMPRHFPCEQPRRFRFVINLMTVGPTTEAAASR